MSRCQIRAEELSNAESYTELRQKHVNGKEPTSLRRLGKTETRAVYVERVLEMAVSVRQGRSVPSTSPGLPSDKRTPRFAAPPQANRHTTARHLTRPSHLMTGIHDARRDQW